MISDDFSESNYRIGYVNCNIFFKKDEKTQKNFQNVFWRLSWENNVNFMLFLGKFNQNFRRSGPILIR